MPVKPCLQLNHVSFSIPETLIQFSDLSMAFDMTRYGVVGDNGVGKTTLFKLIAGRLPPTQGTISGTNNLLYIPQDVSEYLPLTIAEVLGVDAILRALIRVELGSAAPSDFDLLDGQWDIREKIKKGFEFFQEYHIELKTSFSSLSGGQQVKTLLVKVLLASADFILLDEPTNNLDTISKQQLIQWLVNYRKGILIISHDRELLSHVDAIIEFTSKGIKSYGGNYQHYELQKQLHQTALVKELDDANKAMKKVRKSIQDTQEKHEQRQKKGRQLRKSGSIDKLAADSKMGRSEKSNKRNTTQAKCMAQQAESELMKVKEKIEVKAVMNVSLPNTVVLNNKMVVDVENVTFGYLSNEPLIRNFNFRLIGPRRVAICGKNGTGKTTFIKLLLSKLAPWQGKIKIGVGSVCYLDQMVGFLQPEKTILDNILLHNTDFNIEQGYFILAQFNFRNSLALKKVKHLSGGEKIRAGLAVSLVAEKAPQLVILDEPTNHLDIASLQAIEQMLACYRGALIVISHDAAFLDNIDIDNYVDFDWG